MFTNTSSDSTFQAHKPLAVLVLVMLGLGPPWVQLPHTLAPLSRASSFSHSLLDAFVVPLPLPL